MPPRASVIANRFAGRPATSLQAQSKGAGRLPDIIYFLIATRCLYSNISFSPPAALTLQSIKTFYRILAGLRRLLSAILPGPA